MNPKKLDQPRRETTLGAAARRRLALATVAACGFAAAFVATVAGCNLGVPAAYAIFGPGTIDPEHQLAPVRTVVFVDDRQNVLPRTVLRAAVAERVSQDLLGKKQIPAAVDPKQAIAMTRQKEGGAKPLSIAAIGRELECQQVIYVQVTSFSLSGDGGFSSTATTSGVGMTPTAKATIKVIDVINNMRTYPVGEEGGREIAATMREVDPEKLRTVAERRAVEDRLAVELGDVIGKLFYEHDRIEQGENLGPRSK